MNESGNRSDADAGTTDRRLLRGARARRGIARHAADVASLEGLNGLSIGRLATDLGLSKSGIQTLFGTKEKLQTAAVESAREAFLDAVVRPASSAPRGVARFRALTEHWVAYAEAPLFPGGCFWTANLADFDSRPGAVRDALFGHHQDWLAALAGELREAVRNGEIADLDADLAAFQIDAVLGSANIALRIGDNEAVHKARRVIDGFLTPPGHAGEDPDRAASVRQELA
ncbi:TetR/AcrR family transcriptional regulator [Streptomyces sp. ISL-10]|uniref:TetR/AcrR family transcriptional regulator n=1 Tax=Streptomyces sp. ISL-10 TaxID=2819172 RepID=UPI001BE5AD81|nr:TetR/AcrR family transcriptional regulator [Streptomyces sp. ISL-10]MBT2365562.1 TetR/AcrR family transcriptional regulator [Streptomyces sp. ISL-10]